jgi:PhnB protein
MKMSPYLFFNGNCREAFEYYERHLGGKIGQMLTGADAPEGMDATPDMIMHANMTLGGGLLMASDCGTEDYKKPQGFYVSLSAETPEEAERIFDALADGGEVRMALEKTFWAERFGMLVDRFGIPWMISCDGSATNNA